MITVLLGLLACACACVLAGSASGAPSFALRGVLQSGGTVSARPLAGVRVALLEATAGRPVLVDQATTAVDGRFTLASPQGSSNGVFYLAADVDRGVEFATVLGPSLPPSATVNELTTVAAGYAMAQSTRDGSISGDPFALGIAAGMNDNVVDTRTGGSSPVLLRSPNGDETNSLRVSRSLANLLAACVRSRSATAAFLAATKQPGEPPPPSTLQALANLARDPAGSVRQIDRLTRLDTVFEPALEGAPDNWSIAVKVNDTGDDRYLFGGPGNLAFDNRGYAWVTNNVVQGTPNSTTAVAVLKPNGQAADGVDGTPASPLTGAGVFGTGFGVAVDASGIGWFGNFGWGGEEYDPQPGASISRFSTSGTPLSGSGEGGDVDRAQGMTTDADGNVWVTSFGNDSVFVFPGGDVDAGVRFPEYEGSQPFDVAIAADGAAWVTNSGGLLGKFPSSVARFTFQGGILRRTVLRHFGASLRGVDVDSQGNVWVASLGDGYVYGLRPDGSFIGRYRGGGIDGPWDVTIDGDDNLWIANFGQTELGNVFDGRVTKLCGIRGACPPGKKTGDAITPRTGYTVPSAGSQVLLHDGTPLYGPKAPPSYIPMMRQTASAIDRAGNLWTVNNWKPNLTVDATVNPGGDGILIFVGLAPPRR